MASGVSIEILDLRHFAAPMLRPCWRPKASCGSNGCIGTIAPSAKLLMQYLDGHMLPGYAALEAGQIIGYVFCVYEETKAVIGDALRCPAPEPTAVDCAHEIEETLLRHLLECWSTRRRWSASNRNCCCTPPARWPALFLDAGFQVYRRLFMVQQLEGYFVPPRVHLPAGWSCVPGATRI